MSLFTMSTTNLTSRTSNSVGNPTMERFLPGAVVAVGTHRVEVVNYLAEGGFAQIYVVKFLEYLNEFENKSKVPMKVGDVACLKRVLVQDENGLSEMRNEVEVMKQLMGAQNIVQYYDSNACRRHNGNAGFEVLLLMELCPNKSLLDYMNQRLATKLTEKEILKIMYDVSLAVSQMHYLKNPLIHRDIKIENVLVDAQNSFKLCDFGSTSQCFPVVTTHQEIAILTQNIYVHTTPQYRCPEMIDLYRCLPINEKSDIWALGIFLYKLLFFITPFEMTGQFAILHSKYEFPPNHYSSQLINLIIIMLAENPFVRPNIYQVLNHICTMIGVEVPIEDKYGCGAYNFDKYAEFQTKLQNAQYQMYMLQQKKLENRGILDPSDESLLNNLMITAFEVSGKIPMEANSRESTKSPEVQDLKLAKGASEATEDKPDQHPVSSSDEMLVKRTSSSKTQEKSHVDVAESAYEIGSEKHDGTSEVINQVPSETDALSNKGEPEKQSSIIETAVPPADDLHMAAPNLEQRQKSSSSISSESKSYMSGPQGLSSEELTEHAIKAEIAPGTKQHKSNNPFPRMATDYPDAAHQENIFMDDSPRNALNNQQRLHFPPKDLQYKAERERIQLQQGPQFVSPPSQRQQIQQQYPYRNDLPQGIQQQQQYPTPFNQEIPNYVGPNMRYAYQGIPPNANVPYYPAQQVKQQQQPQPQPQKVMYPTPQQSVAVPLQVQAQAGSRIPQQASHPVSNRTQEDIPPPMPPRHEQLLKEGEKQKREEELLIAFSPPKQHGDQNVGDRPNPEILTSPSRRGNLDLSYNEMDFSQEDLMKDRQDPLDTGGMDSSIASSESIEMNLEDTKRGNRSLRINRSEFPRGYDSPIPRRHEAGNEKNSTDEREAESVKETSGRRSLDLKFHEVRFSSPDLNNQNVPVHSGHLKESSANKHKPTHSHKQRNTESTDAVSHVARRNHSTGSSSSASRKHSSNNINVVKTGSHARNDLERTKTSNGSSNTSVNNSSTNLSGMRRSFAKARQSLDLERVRREALNNSDSAISGKRRSLFSVFRGNSDKK